MSNQKKQKSTTPKGSRKKKSHQTQEPVKKVNSNNDLSMYESFVNNYKQNMKAKMDITHTTNMLNKSKSDLDAGKCYPTSLTDHAFHQIIDRLEELSLKYDVVYNDIMTKPVYDSIFLPSKLREFVFDKVCVSIKDDTKTSKKSRSGGVEYIFNVHMDNWNIGGGKHITFSVIVENNVVKTGYFNVHDK